MESTIKEKIMNIQPGDMQRYRNVTVFPLFCRFKPPVKHLVLKEAMEQGLITIGEVNERGHVPQLKVTSNASAPVLILDGEELFGAKQNRVLNTTVLLRKHSVTIIPVSCTEQGRWHYESKTFTESGIIMSPRLRELKNRSVQESLRTSREFRSDQGAIWNGISEQADHASVSSPTSAMRDVHENRREDISDYGRHFPLVPGQQGILVVIGSEVIGMDVVAYPQAYALLHDKLVQSYVMDAIIQESNGHGNPGKEKAQAFIDGIGECTVTRYKSVAHGWDVRFEGETLFGSALEYRGGAVHLAFFASQAQVPGKERSRMSGYRKRAGFRNQIIY
ncbi:MAG TPA: hypothetical protein PLT30_16805 [Deltaproteobacteria bacterium]|nr:hypothetical protein [Deltaproteobacteria bacterium]